ncbi:hypothetical protein A8F94_22185 [Bacillus sp. FJAT-27225]|uniref:GNAT family N-acetyltransferase n=1 Tax=Bacillus sp. FJAT-27225 TaxID=1743144 RepID=UPI00080C263C|nr:GNAT family N-acetyltransferase [Bacillus sp. FJAT-27225]OCA81582.1 hypothetical protein A8F94_22185 [Bacillus sp. FJAT-27225]
MGENFKLIVETNPDHARYVRERLVEFNKPHLSEAYRIPLEDVHIFLKDEQGTIVGGLLGGIKLKCLYIDIFWLDETLRGEGKGSEVLGLAEKYALEKGCTFVKLDTFSFQAPDFYQKQGYKIYGTLENFPEEGITHYYLYKKLEEQ